MKNRRKRFGMVLGRSETPDRRVIRTGSLAAQGQRLIAGESGGILVSRRRRSQNEIPLRSYAHVISVLGYERVAQRVDTRLDQLLAIVFHSIGKTNRPHERALSELWKDHTEGLRSVRFFWHGFADPDVAQGAAWPGDAN